LIAMTQATQWLVWIAVFAGSVVLSYIYSGLETGIYVMNKIRLDLRAESGSKSARRIRGVIRNQANFLAVLLLGNNTVNYAATFAIGAMFLLAGCGERSEWYTMAVAPVLFIFCESLPKNVARRASEKMVYQFSLVLSASSWLFNASGLAPLVRGFSRLMLMMLRIPNRSYIPMGHEGLSAIVAESQASGVLTHLQTVMAERVMNIAGVRLRDVMIPMAKVIYAPTHVTNEAMLELMRAHNYSRFPAVDDDGKVVAILNIYDALAGADRPEPSGRNAKPLYLPATMTVTDALYHMQREHAPMAIVVDDPGNHVGIVTTKDLVEEIVGELDVW
jgi:putative hemolysin